MVDHGVLQTVGHVPQAQELANDIITHLVKIGHLDNQIQEPNMKQNSRLRLVSTYMKQTDESTDMSDRDTNRQRQTDRPDRVVFSPQPQWHVASCGERCQQDVDTSPDSEKICK